MFSPDVIYGTGTLVWQTFPRLESMGSTTMWSDPLSEDQVKALKYFAATEFMSDLLAQQGQTLLGDIDALVAKLAQAGGS